MQLLSSHKESRLTRLLRFCITGFLIGLFAIQVDLATVHAAPPAQDTPPPPRSEGIYNRLNVLFVVDQSGSMGGPPYGGLSIYGPAGNDPDGLRFYTPQYFFDKMVYYHDRLVALGDGDGFALSDADTAKPEIYMAQIAFGTVTETVMSWYPIDTDRFQADQMLDEVIGADGDLSELRFQGRNLTDTDFQRAFINSEQLFLDLPARRSGTRELNIIVVVTDGAPCTIADGNFHNPPDENGRITYNCSFNASDYASGATAARQRINGARQRLQRLRQIVSETFGGSNYMIYVVALDEENRYWAELEDLWQDIVCPSGGPCTSQLRRVTTAIGMAEYVDECVIPDIFELLSGFDITRTRIDDTTGLSSFCTPDLSTMDSGRPRFTVFGRPSDIYSVPSPREQTITRDEVDRPGFTTPFEVGAYQQALRIDLFKSDNVSSGGIALRHTGGLNLSNTLPNSINIPASTPNRPIETYVIDSPTAGPWEIDIINPNVVSSVTIETISGGVRMNPPAEAVNMFSSVSLSAYFVDGDNDVMPFDRGASGAGLSIRTTFYRIEGEGIIDRGSRTFAGEITLTHNGSAASEYEGSWIPDAPGRYEVRATAQLGDIILAEDRTVLDNLLIRAVVPSNFDIEPNTVLEGENFVARASMKVEGTDEPIANASQFNLRASVYPIAADCMLSVAANEPINDYPIDNLAGLGPDVTGDFTILQPGRYCVQLEAGRVTGGNFVALEPLSIPKAVEVNERRELMLSFVEPETGVTYAQDIALSPFTFELNVPVDVQLQLTDQHGTAISLAALTGDPNARPMLILNPGSDEQNLTDNLIETRNGIYVTTLDLGTLGFGSYELVASSNAALPEDSTWVQGSVSREFTREISPALLIAIAIALVIIILLAILALVLLAWQRRRTENPIIGQTLDFYTRYPNGQENMAGASANLGEIKVNTHTIFGPSPFGKVKISTRRDVRTSENAHVHIEAIDFTDPQIESKYESEKLRPRRKVLVGIKNIEGGEQIEYYIGKDMGEVMLESQSFDQLRRT